MPVARIRAKYLALKPALDERLTRLWAGAEAEAAGERGITIVARATGMSRTTIRAGRDELRKGLTDRDVVRVRRAGGGRQSIEDKVPGIVDALEGLIEPVVRGDRESPLRWTLKSTRSLSTELHQRGLSISPQKVGQLLHARGYVLRSGRALMVATPPAVRHRQFELINARVEACLARNAPVISVDTRYVEPAGDAAHRGHDRLPRNEHALDDARHIGWTHADVDREISAFALLTITEWWERMMERARLPGRELLVTVDGVGGGARTQHWQSELQRFANHSGLIVGVSHFPPGTSRWTRVEHRLLYHVTESVRGHARGDREVAIQLIGGARAAHRPAVPAPHHMRALGTDGGDDGGLLATREGLYGEWNYTLYPRRERPL